MKKIILTFLIFTFLCNCTTEENTNKSQEKKKNTIDITELNAKELLNHITNLEKNLLDTASNILATNKENAIKLLEGTNNFAERFKENSERRAIIYRGVMAARGLGNNNEAIRLLDKILTEYPNDNKKVDVLFEKAFLLDEKIKKTEKAKAIYSQIAKEYPTHQFGIDSKARLITIDMTDEQLLDFFAKQNGQ